MEIPKSASDVKIKMARCHFLKHSRKKNSSNHNILSMSRFVVFVGKKRREQNLDQSLHFDSESQIQKTKRFLIYLSNQSKINYYERNFSIRGLRQLFFGLLPFHRLLMDLRYDGESMEAPKRSLYIGTENRCLRIDL